LRVSRKVLREKVERFWKVEKGCKDLFGLTCDVCLVIQDLIHRTVTYTQNRQCIHIWTTHKKKTMKSFEKIIFTKNYFVTAIDWCFCLVVSVLSAFL
jgi:hypothetical protein